MGCELNEQDAMSVITPPSPVPSRALAREAAMDEKPDYWTQLAWITAGASPLMAWRRAAGLSVAELARLSGIGAEVIVAIEARGHLASYEERCLLSQALCLGPGDLED